MLSINVFLHWLVISHKTLSKLGGCWRAALLKNADSAGAGDRGGYNLLLRLQRACETTLGPSALEHKSSLTYSFAHLTTWS